MPRKPTRYLFRICQLLCPNLQKLQTLSSRYIQEKEFKKQLWLWYAFMKNRSSTWKTSRYQSFFLNRFSMSIYRYISRLEARLSVSQISSSIRYMCSIPSLNLDYSMERQNRNSITWNYMTMYEIFLISITEQSGKKRTVGTHTNTNYLLKINVHNKCIVY